MKTKLILALLLGVSCLWSYPCYSQEADEAATPPPATIGEESGFVILYDGQTKGNAWGVSPAPWGGGLCSEVTDYHYRGPKCLKMTIRGLYEGARLDFLNGPPMVTNAEGAYLVFVVMFEDSEKASAGGQDTRGTGKGKSDTEGIGGLKGGGGAKGLGGGTKDTKKEETKEKKIENLKLMAMFDQGLLIAERYGIIIYGTDANGWATVAVPLKVFKGSSEIKGNLRRLVVCGDGQEDLYVGQVALAVDRTPMKAEIRAATGEVLDTETRPGREVELWLKLNPGLAAVGVTWDFDANDGIGEDAKGLQATHVYDKPGTYTVTAVTKDIALQKSPTVATFTVYVKGE